MNTLSLSIALPGVISIDFTEFQAVAIILVIVLAVAGMIIIGVRRARKIKEEDQFTHDRIEHALDATAPATKGSKDHGDEAE